MEIPLISSSNQNPLILRCETSLLDGELIQFKYPENLMGKIFSDKEWEDSIQVIKNLNKETLSVLRNNANVYAIFVKEENGQWESTYVGERKASGIRERMTQHLITKDKATGSKLYNIKNCVSKGMSIGLRFIKVEPESLRLFIEEMLISRNKSKLKWNKHG